MFALSQKQRLILGAVGAVALLTAICLIFGAIFKACDERKIKKSEANTNAAQTVVEADEQKVNDAKQTAAEAKGEIKIQKEARDETNVEVKQKIEKRRSATANRERVRRNRLRNVNGTDLNRILNDADAANR